ncbi:alpha/beta hydrolase [Xanthobacter oligotrophicus]|uniref:Alpha/beta hydrolase n=1 Tax=Xanthobacter oligotrophicus TaxID=2607286 RepID=A0ABW6ZW62_9HYPH
MALHPQTKAFLDAYNASAPAIDYDTISADDLRRLFAIPKPTVASSALTIVEDAAIDGPSGPIGLRCYLPEGLGPFPLTLFIHGGGFVIGSLDTTDGLCRTLAEGAGSLVVSVDYRRAPEAPFPAGLDDCWSALRWLAERGQEIGGDPSRIAVAGNSSGGNFAAVLAQQAKREGLDLRHQLLLFPVADGRMAHSSHHLFGDGYFLTAAMMRWFWKQYLPAGADALNPRATPLLAHDFSGLAPATVFTAEFDVLRDEGEDYARSLKCAGVPVTLKRWPGQIHDFTLMQGAVADADTALAEAGQALRTALGDQSG